MDIAISQVVDHDIASTKMRVHFFANLGSVSFQVTTLFSRDNLEEYWDYQKQVRQIFNDLAKKYSDTMATRVVE